MEMAAKNKKMNVDFLINDAKKYEKLKKVTFDNGMYTEVYIQFSNDRIDSCLDDCGKFISEYSKTRKITEEKMLDYINLHILKWFTTALEIKTNSFEETVMLFDKLRSSNYIELFFEEFDKSEVAKVFARMQKKLDTLVEVSKSNVDVRNQIRDYVKDSDIENKAEILGAFFGETDVSEHGKDV